MTKNESNLFSQSQEPEHRHRNHFLFSDYYLNQLLFGNETWQAEIAPALAFFKWLKKLYSAEKANLATYNEAQLEANWIQPILDKMGWVGTYETQAVIPALQEKQIRKPDYIFFATADERKEAATQQNTSQYTKKAILVGDAKRWSVALNRKQDGKPTFENNNPSHQIDYYLRATELSWGILTNGRYWRLVHKDTSYKLDVYYEIDLEDLLKEDSKNGLLYFWLFFRHGAFVPDKQGKIFVEEGLTASRNYAREVENDLRDNAYKALELLIEGFFAFKPNQLSAENPAHLEAVYINSLYLLYRLLFLLYSESRNLLPLNNPDYFRVSLTHLIKHFCNELDKGQKFSPFGTQYWSRQKDLSDIIHGTNPDANRYYDIPLYNGGLFSPTKHPFLEKHKMSDAHLIRAIDYLARRDRLKEGDRPIKERVDYRTLGVRQLGSIYEGLLEYRPAQAKEAMVTVLIKGNELWVSADKRGKKLAIEHRAIGQLYLETDNGERKATGSYYTPDYIVKYIVEETIGPLVNEIEEKVAQLPESERGEAFSEQLLALKILDPAMGSGHFLVAAAEYLALKLTKYDFCKPSNLPDLTELSDEERQVEEKNEWLRRVAENCIYGVDKNEMAVELAKLSLWLTTVSADKPLSFLDHHLRHGDSLVGARLSDLHTLPQSKKQPSPEEQVTLLDQAKLTTDLYLAVGGMKTIQRVISDSLEDIELKERLFSDLRQQIAKWQKLADLWVSSYFGNNMTPQEYADAARLIQGKETTARPEQLQPFLDHSAVQTSDYFHWELEFPELFFDEYGNALKEKVGFDAVIGNPPYVRIQGLNADSAEYANFYRTYFTTATGSFDIYALFVEKSYQLLHGKGGLILPNKWPLLTFGKGVRTLLSQNKAVSKIIDFDGNQVFEGITTYTCLLFLSGTPCEQFDYVALPHQTDVETEIGRWLKKESSPMPILFPIEQFSEEVWLLISGKSKLLADKIATDASPLDAVAQQIFQGLITSADAVYILKDKGVKGKNRKLYSTASKTICEMEPDLLHPLASGVDVDRYRYPQTTDLLIFPYQQTEKGVKLIPAEEMSKKYPLTWAYLQTHEQTLRGRERGKMNHDGWYGYVYPKNLDKHNRPKLAVARLVDRLKFMSDLDAQLYLDNVDVNGVLLNPDSPLSGNYLLAVLNSRLLDWRFKKSSVPFRGAFYSANKQFIAPLPIRTIAFTTPPDERKQLLAAAQNSADLVEFCQQQLSAERIDVVHDILAWLAERMTERNRECQTEIAGFLEWLSEFSWVDVAQWQLKTVVQEYHRQEWEQFKRALLRNKTAIEAASGKNIENRHNLTEIKTAFTDSITKLQLILAEIGRIDAQIDQIVYKLYGLTDEEIAIVEAASAENNSFGEKSEF